MGKRKLPEGVLDSETDPFIFERIPEPFAWGLYIDGAYYQTWGINCTRDIVDIIRDFPECILYAHNGGKFDFHFLLPYADTGSIKIINGRIAKFNIGGVTLIDSYLLMPFALGQYQKVTIDYEKFEETVRELHKKEITHYLQHDCLFLYDLLKGFKKIVGNKLTIGGAAFQQMKALGIKIEKLGQAHDVEFRKFYFGGRVQAFKPGSHYKTINIIDIKSAYPTAMQHDHAAGLQYVNKSELPDKAGPWFALIDADSRGALPLRNEKGGLDFPNGINTFYATGWEIIAGIETGTLDVLEVYNVWIPLERINFNEYVNKYYNLRKQAKADGDKIKTLAYKYLLNSGYGKFATDPAKFKDYELIDYEDNLCGDGFSHVIDYGAISLWERDAFDENGFFDVATAASITGWVRAYLWRSICACDGVYYCDTDSIFCDSHSVDIGPDLGQWEVEGVASELHIAGKKLYAAKLPGNWKIASKGARLTEQEIIAICAGNTVKWQNAAPTYSISKGVNFTQRNIKLVTTNKGV